ncbi:unnamed protein product [Sympodiomycopsis kandeliae]
MIPTASALFLGSASMSHRQMVLRLVLNSRALPMQMSMADNCRRCQVQIRLTTTTTRKPVSPKASESPSSSRQPASSKTEPSSPNFKDASLPAYVKKRKVVVESPSAKTAEAAVVVEQTEEVVKKPPLMNRLATSILPSKVTDFNYSPYIALSRIDKPIGTWLLFWPCAWSMTLAAHAHALSPYTLAGNLLLFGTGAFIMRGAGCTINDMWDTKMDRLVSRTANRPLAAGDITHHQALKFLALQLSVGLAILLQLNWYSIFLGASSLAVVVIYPLMKRFTYWPQLVLGFAFNWGALLGYTSLHLPPNWSVILPLYAGSIFWTLVYDTIYAHQDVKDDINAGVKSTALLFGDYSKPILSAFSLSFVSLLSAAVLQVETPFTMSTTMFSLQIALTDHPVFLMSLWLILAHLNWQIFTVDLSSRADCWKKFVSNSNLGLLIWVALLGDYIWFMYAREEQQEQQEHTKVE